MTKTTITLTFAIASILIASPFAMPNAHAGCDDLFVDYYDHPNWSFSDDGGDGFIEFQNTCSVEIIGDDSESGVESFTSYTREMPCDGNVSFLWFYTTSDNDGPTYDPAGYSINGEFTQVTDDLGADNQDGNETVPVQQGDIFGWVVSSMDGYAGHASIFAVPTEFPPVDCPTPVEIDIKPGSDPNSIKVDNKGVIPVAILGSATLDVSNIDVTTLAFGPSGAAPKHDLTDPEVYAEHTQDVNGDGMDDLVSHYVNNESGITCGDAQATLTWETLGGIPMFASDSIRTVPCK